jgi:hypothetical protein
VNKFKSDPFQNALFSIREVMMDLDSLSFNVNSFTNQPPPTNYYPPMRQSQGDLYQPQNNFSMGHQTYEEPVSQNFFPPGHKFAAESNQANPYQPQWKHDQFDDNRSMVSDIAPTLSYAPSEALIERQQPQRQDYAPPQKSFGAHMS